MQRHAITDASLSPERVKKKGGGKGFLLIALVLIVVALQAFELTQAFGGLVDSPLWILRPLAWGVVFSLAGNVLASAVNSEGKMPIVLRFVATAWLPLVMAVAFAAFLIGPLATEVSLSRYVWGYDLWRYLLGAVAVPSFVLPGVFSLNIQTSTVNGMLWAIPVFFTLSAVALAAPASLLRRRLMLIGVVFIACAASWAVLNQGIWILADSGLSRGEGVGFPLLGFLAGIGGLVTFDLSWPRRTRLLLFVSTLFAIAAGALLGERGWSGYTWFCIAIAIAAMPIVAHLVALLNFRVKQIEAYASLAYMALLVSFPIQQSLIKWLPISGRPLPNLGLAIPLTAFAAVILQAAVVQLAASVGLQRHVAFLDVQAIKSLPRYSSAWWKRKAMKTIRFLAILLLLALVATGILMIVLLAFQSDSGGV